MRDDSARQTWWLDNAEQRNLEHPDSFFIPSHEKRHNLKPGDTVKLIFAFDPPDPDDDVAERMWVEVTASKGDDGTYIGKLLNDPDYIQTLKPGDEVRFKPHHVAGFAYSEEELGYDPDAVAIVSRRIRDEGARPYYVYRNPQDKRDDPAGQIDSGWQLFAAEDDDEYLEDPDNTLVWDLGWIADKFPDVEALFRIGSAEGEWVWDDAAESFVSRA